MKPMIDQHCERCGGTGWITTEGMLCTDNKRRTVRCKCPACNCGDPEREADCARAVQEFIDAHHNPIVAEKNAEITRLCEQVANLKAMREDMATEINRLGGVAFAMRQALTEIAHTHGYSDNTMDNLRHMARQALSEPHPPDTGATA